jgi:hypothetical protein
MSEAKSLIEAVASGRSAYDVVKEAINLPSLDEAVSEPDMRAIKAFKEKGKDAVKGVLLRYTGNGEKRGELWQGSKRLADWVSGSPYINPKAPKAVQTALRN